MTASPKPARPIAAIDVGSNSIQLTLARVEDGRVLIIDRLKNPARMRAAVGPDGYFDPVAADRMMDTFRAFRRRIETHGAVARATGTAALRAARDGDAFIARVARETGIEIELISGGEEGRLVLVGVMHGLPRLRRCSPLCVDVGGGSAELILGRAGRTAAVASLPLGSQVVCQRWLGPDPVLKRTVRRALDRVTARLAPRVRDMKRLGIDEVVGTGGSIQRIARIALALEGRRPVSVHGFRLERRALDAVLGRLIGASTLAERKAIPGMDAERADTLLGGALVFEALSRLLDVESWTVSMDALRTGLILDTHARYVAERERTAERLG